MGVAFTGSVEKMVSQFVLLGLFASALGAPLQDTAEVLEAKEKFNIAFENAREGKHIALAPVNNDVQAPQIANAYLDDTEPVVEEKKKFELAFNTAKEGGLKHMQAEPVVTFYIAKTEEVVDAEKDFMEEFALAEKGEHMKYAPVNNDLQAPQIENAYIPYTQEVIDAAEQFMTYFAEAKLKSLESMPVPEKADAAVEVAPAVEAAPAVEVAAVKSAAVPKAEPVVSPVVYTVPQLYGYPAYTYPMLPMKYVLLPVTAPLAATSAVEKPANDGTVVEEA